MELPFDIMNIIYNKLNIDNKQKILLLNKENYNNFKDVYKYECQKEKLNIQEKRRRINNNFKTIERRSRFGYTVIWFLQNHTTDMKKINYINEYGACAVKYCRSICRVKQISYTDKILKSRVKNHKKNKIFVTINDKTYDTTDIILNSKIGRIKIGSHLYKVDDPKTISLLKLYM